MIFNSREIAFDDLKKSKKEGYYRVKIIDKKELNKKGEPLIKFKYYDLKNNKEVNEEELIRINKLRIANIYEDVWVNDNKNDKIQATGIDPKGIKQYRYNDNHLKTAHELKFKRMYQFIKKLPILDVKIKYDLENEKPYNKNRVIALMIFLLRKINLRIGKEKYAKKNKSYGLCSLKKTHIKIKDDKVKFKFRAKSRQIANYEIKDDLIINELKLLIKLEGHKLFQYIKHDMICKISDTDLNGYLQLHMGRQFTCKDFRTYASNYYFVKALIKETKKHQPINDKIIKKNINKAVEQAAYQLRHSKTINKNSYTLNFISTEYINNPEYFIKNCHKKTDLILLELLKKFLNKEK